jgi:hypothetical protein
MGLAGNRRPQGSPRGASSFAGWARLRVEAAGFTDVDVQQAPSPLHLPSAVDCVLFEKESFGALHQMMPGLDPQTREDTWARITDELSVFDGPDRFVGPCEMLVAGAVNPG